MSSPRVPADSGAATGPARAAHEQADGAAKAKRVAIVYRNLASLSGTPNTIFSHARYLAAAGFEVDLLAEKVDASRIEGERIGTVRFARLPLFKRDRLDSFARRVARHTRGRYDFVAGHGHCADADVVSLHNCERLCHLKVHGEEMTARDPVAEFQDRLFAEQRFRLCIANSRLMREELVARYGVPRERIRVIHPGYDAERFRPEGREHLRDQTRCRLGIEPGQTLIGVVTSGAFAIRGLDLAIDAFAGLPASLRRNAHLLVIGRASSIERYERQAARLGLEPHVTFMRPTRAIEEYFHALDICLHPARLETFGQSVQEAMACGVPVITNRQVGAAELLSEFAYAALPEVSTVPELAAELETLIVDADARAARIRDGLEAIAGNTLEANCERTLAVYREAGL